MTPKPSAPRVAAHRARKAAAGLAEVRGIWAPKEDHARVKEFAANAVKWRDDLNEFRRLSKSIEDRHKAKLEAMVIDSPRSKVDESAEAALIRARDIAGIDSHR